MLWERQEATKTHPEDTELALVILVSSFYHKDTGVSKYYSGILPIAF